MFDEIHTLRAVDDRAFLVEVLRRRVPSELLGGSEREVLIHWSGGIVRHLLQLTSCAAAEAYMHGADAIGAEHVASAAYMLGSSLRIGLGDEDVALLLEVHTTPHLLGR